MHFYSNVTLANNNTVSKLIAILHASLPIRVNISDFYNVQQMLCTMYNENILSVPEKMSATAGSFFSAQIMYTKIDRHFLSTNNVDFLKLMYYAFRS